MEKREFCYPSSDGRTRIHAVAWVPEHPSSILQICHGMVEYTDRYDAFARKMAARNFLVTGNDHLGHGQSVRTEEDLGWFAEKDGWQCLLEDMEALRARTAAEYPGLPYFLLGHSMGSFLARHYLETRGGSLSGAVIMGTGQQNPAALRAGLALCRCGIALKGDRFRSKLIDGMAMGGYSRAFRPARTRADWLTRNEAVVDAYCADPLCSFRFTLNAYAAMFGGLLHISCQENADRIPKDLPVLFVSGAEDPVGNRGRGVEQAAAMYRKAGLRNVSVKLYPQDRHEILNEPDRETVIGDLAGWLEKQMNPEKSKQASGSAGGTPANFPGCYQTG